MEKNALSKEIKYYDSFWQKYPQRIKNSLFNYHGISRHKSILQILKSLDIDTPSILDIGCGSGLLISQLTKFSDQVTGIDFSKTAIELAQKRYPKINFFVVDISNNKKTKKKLTPPYDVIILSEVIEHIKDKNVLFKSVYSLLSNQGYFILTTPNADICKKYNITGDQFREEFITYRDIRKLSEGLFNISFKGSTYFINPNRRKPIRWIAGFLKVYIFRQILKPTEDGLYMAFLLRKIPSNFPPSRK